jgi:RNA polymerase sigma-70 factor (ECF subfamily)
MYRALPENELIELLKKSHERAFEELFMRFEQRVFLYAVKLTKSREVAEEILHDVFIKVWEHRENIDPSIPLSAIIFTIAKNNILNHLRQESRFTALKKEYSLSVVTSTNATEDGMLMEEYLHVTNRAIENLPAQRRSIFKMSRIEGKSYEEIAESLGISKDTVRNQMIKSLKTIREYIAVHIDVQTAILGLLALIF